MPAVYCLDSNGNYRRANVLKCPKLLLTSSTRTPKFIRKQWRNTLMAFHQHSSVDYLLVLRQCNLYGHYSFILLSDKNFAKV